MKIETMLDCRSQRVNRERIINVGFVRCVGQKMADFHEYSQRKRFAFSIVKLSLSIVGLALLSY